MTHLSTRKRLRSWTRTGFAAMTLLTVVAAVVLDSAAHSWVIDRPDLLQVVLCVVLVAAGATDFWTWCAVVGLLQPRASSARSRSTASSRSAARQAALLRREQRLRHQLPVAWVLILIGPLILLF